MAWGWSGRTLEGPRRRVAERASQSRVIEHGGVGTGLRFTEATLQIVVVFLHRPHVIGDAAQELTNLVDVEPAQGRAESNFCNSFRGEGRADLGPLIGHPTRLTSGDLVAE